MRFFSTAVSVALAAFATIAVAQTPTKNNAITHPVSGERVTAGSSYTIQWINQAGGPVTLTLMDGPVNDPNGLKPVATIVSGAPNSGSYIWRVPSNLPASQTYSIRISYDSNPNNFNYSDRFVLISSVTASATTASSTAPPTTTSTPATTSTTEMSTETSTETSTTESESTTSAPTSANSTTTITTSTRLSSTSTRRSSTSAPTSQPTDGAPPSAASSTLSSPLAVIMAVLAAALFIH